MPHIYHSGFQAWHVVLALGFVFVAAFYLHGWIMVRNFGHNGAAAWRAVSFLLGLFLIWLVIASPIARLDHHMLTAHMFQHLVLMTLAPPLIWFGSPAKTLLNGLGQQFMEVSDKFRCSQLTLRIRQKIAQPVVCWFAGAVTLIGWHIPSVFALGMQSEAWHTVEQVSFLLAGFLFWGPVVRPRPSAANSSEWMILLYLFLATLPCDILSGFLVFCDRVVYPVYYSLSPLPGFSPLEDQQCAGALMWTGVTIVYLVAGTLYAARLLSPVRLRQLQIAATPEPQPRVLSQKNPCALEIV